MMASKERHLSTSKINLFKMGSNVLEYVAGAVMRLLEDLSSFGDCFYKQPG